VSHHVRLAEPGDRPRIRELIAEYLPDLDPDRRLHWLYDSNPHGPAITWLAIEDGTGVSVGMTSFFRRRMVAGGDEIGGALGGDGYVRPAFRRRGIGQQMHAASRRDMARLGVEVMFGTPMPANVTPLESVGAKTIGDTVRFARPLSGEALHLPGVLAKLATPLVAPRGSDAKLEPARNPDPRIDAVWAAARPEFSIATIRDAAFYAWRFSQSPSQAQRPFVIVLRGQPIAACALETVGENLRIVDLVAPARHFAQALRAIAAQADKKAVEIKFVREDAASRGLLRQGYLSRDTKPFNIMLPEGSTRERLLYDPARWYFTWAEADMDHA
jgi:GNAT superfamily N-acetyltransferase